MSPLPNLRGMDSAVKMSICGLASAVPVIRQRVLSGAWNYENRVGCYRLMQRIINEARDIIATAERVQQALDIEEKKDAA